MKDVQVTFFPGYDLSYEAEYADIQTVEVEPDPVWKFIDGSGHGHFFHPDAFGPYPTLEWEYTPCTMGGHEEDCQGEGYYRCKACRQRVVPDTRPARVDPRLVKETFTLVTTRSGVRKQYIFDKKAWDILQEGIHNMVSIMLQPYLREVDMDC